MKLFVYLALAMSASAQEEVDQCSIGNAAMFVINSIWKISLLVMAMLIACCKQMMLFVNASKTVTLPTNRLVKIIANINTNNNWPIVSLAIKHVLIKLINTIIIA